MRMFSNGFPRFWQKIVVIDVSAFEKSGLISWVIVSENNLSVLFLVNIYKFLVSCFLTEDEIWSILYLVKTQL